MNYLMSGTSDIVIGEQRSRAETVTVNDMYRLYIYNGSGTIQFSGYVPEDFNFSLQGGWNSILEGLTLGSLFNEKGAMIDRTASIAGVTTKSKILTGRVWDSPQHFILELPIFLDAYSSTEDEVLRPMVELLSMAAPNEKGTILIPPGPVMTKEALGALQDAVSSRESTESSAFESEEAFTVRLGNFFTMPNAIITNVSGSGDSSFEDATGNPISADFMVTVESYFAVTRQDLYQWFGLEGGDYSLSDLQSRVLADGDSIL